MKSRTGLTALVSRECDSELLSCQDIEIFKLNQRRSINPKYAEIKESIRSGGLQQPLHVVFHPKDQIWVLSQGGQTRLQILWELFKETGEDRYLYPKIIKEEYISDLNLCIAHMIENRMRADNNFYETATAVVNARALMAEEGGDRPTQEELVEMMTEKGICIRRQSVTAMLYLATELGPRITNEAFLKDVSRKLIDSIRTLKKGSGLSDEKFDNKLIEHINGFRGNVTAKTIKDHFLGKPKTYLAHTNYQLAEKLVGTWGLDGLVEANEGSVGFTLNFPEHFDDKRQAKFCFLLASVAGLFTDQVGELEMLGFGDDPEKRLSTACEMVGISERELLNHQVSAFYETNDDEFESLIQLIVGVRKKFCNNNK